jgi:hypothetical protein
LRRIAEVAGVPVAVVEDAFAAGVCLPIAALILSAFLVTVAYQPGLPTRGKFCEFQRRFYGYIIVDAPSLFMCSGNFG